MSAVTPSYGDLPRDFEPGVNLDVREQISKRRWSPRRNRWAQLAEFDARAAELERRQAEVTAELRDLNERRAGAPNEDVQRLAEWELRGRKGRRPESVIPELDAALKARRDEEGGLLLAIAAVLEEKVEFVTRHRRRLRQEADREVDAAHKRLVDVIAQIAPARQQVVEAREAAVWMAIYPDARQGQSPQSNFLGGGLLRIAEVLGIRSQLQHSRVVDALVADADWVAAAASPEERALMEGRHPRAPKGAAWSESDEYRAERQAELDQALQAFRAEWGRDPTEPQLVAFMQARG